MYKTHYSFLFRFTVGCYNIEKCSWNTHLGRNSFSARVNCQRNEGKENEKDDGGVSSSHGESYRISNFVPNRSGYFHVQTKN